MERSLSTTASRASGGAAHVGDPVLAELLDRELDWSPRARGPYISHFSMGLVAARRLGASDQWLRSHFEQNAADDFHVARDRPEWLAADTVRIDATGIDQEVRRRVPAVIDDLDAQFYHAVIRLELAIDAGHHAQVANALRNWEDSASESDAATGDGDGCADPDAADPDAADPDAADPGAAVDELSRLAAVAHLEAANFGTLHLVTGTRAITAMLPHLAESDRQRLVRSADRAVRSTLHELEVDLPPEDPGDIRSEQLRRRWARSSAPSWDDLGAAAIADGDVHTMKLVYACRLQEERTGDALFRSVAAQQVSG